MKWNELQTPFNVAENGVTNEVRAQRCVEKVKFQEPLLECLQMKLGYQHHQICRLGILIDAYINKNKSSDDECCNYCS